MGQCRLLSGIQLCERCCEQAEAARCAEQQSTHLTRGVGFASLVHVPSPKLSTHPSLSLSSGPAGDSSDTCGSAYAHPGASANRHVHAGEVSQTVGTEGMLGGEPWHPTWCASGGGRHLLCLLLYWMDSGVKTFPMQLAGAQCCQVTHGKAWFCPGGGTG